MIPLALLLACSDKAEDTGPVDTGPDLPAWCDPDQDGATRYAIEGSPAGPYFVMHPWQHPEEAPLVIFLPGYSGSGGTTGEAATTWNSFFEDDPKEFRVVMPYVLDESYPDTPPDLLAIAEEVRSCWGGDGTSFHLAGHDNGGLLAYNTLGPELVASLRSVMGAPAYLTDTDPAVFVGVPFLTMAGANDKTWARAAEQTHERLQAAGVDSTLVISEGQGHLPNPNWEDRGAMFEHWRAH